MRTYRELLRLPGASGSVVGGFIGRLPLGMRALGCLLLISSTTGSYGQAGLVAAALTLAQAVAAPPLSRAADRLGQRPVLLFALAAHTLALGTLVLLAVTRQPLPLLLAAAVLSGGTSLPLGPLVRARWAALVGGTPRLSPAYAMESVLDELVFVLGPMLATLLAVAVFPAAGLLGSLVLLVIGTLMLAATAAKTTAPVGDSAAGTPQRGVLRTPGIAPLFGVFALLGVFLGAVDVAVLAFAEERGVRGAAGVLLALLAVGSLLAGLVWGAVRAWPFGLAVRLQCCAGALLVAAVPLYWADTVVLMGFCMVLAGVAIAPSMITGSLLVEQLLPRRVLTEGFAWMSSAIAVGMASGAALGGLVIDREDSSAALLVALVAAGCACGASLLTARRLARGTAPLASEPDAPAEGSLPVTVAGVSEPSARSGSPGESGAAQAPGGPEAAQRDVGSGGASPLSVVRSSDMGHG